MHKHKVSPTPQPAKPAFQSQAAPAKTAMPEETTLKTEPVRPEAPHMNADAPPAESAAPNPVQPAEPAAPPATATTRVIEDGSAQPDGDAGKPEGDGARSSRRHR